MSTRDQLIEEILHSLHAIRNHIKAKAVHLGHQNHITHSQWFILKTIEHYKSVSIKDIAETLGMSSSAATQLVDGLVQAGFVIRQENPNDRRLVRLELSPKGKRHIAATKENRITEMAQVFDALNDKELAGYLKLQKKILSKFLHKKS
ncbi:MAG: MarR family transcriptional regulator [bacterium]|nr:MarR family transcriptional regulator [bacterium]